MMRLGKTLFALCWNHTATLTFTDFSAPDPLSSEDSPCWVGQVGRREAVRFTGEEWRHFRRKKVIDLEQSQKAN